MIDIKTFRVGPLLTNCYIVTDIKTGEWAVIDPGFESAELDKALSQLSEDKCRYILLTHGHYDHIGYAAELKEKLGCRLAVSKDDEPFLNDGTLNLSELFQGGGVTPVSADIILSHGDQLTLGETEFKFLSTPGHTVGSGCYVFEDDKAIFSGDILFRESFGRTDFPTGSLSRLILSLRKLLLIDGDMDVYPGHNCATTLSYERKNNPCITFLKDN